MPMAELELLEYPEHQLERLDLKLYCCLHSHLDLDVRKLDYLVRSCQWLACSGFGVIDWQLVTMI